MESKIIEKGYTLKTLILAVREEYLKELKKLDELGDLVIPVSRRVDRLEFGFSGGVTANDIKCDVIKRITKLDQLLHRTDKVVLSTFLYEPHRMIPYVRKDIDRFEELKDEIMFGEYMNHMNSVSRFKSGIEDYLLQTNAEEVRLTRSENTYHPTQSIVFRDGDSLYLSEDTEMADAFNMLNVAIPSKSLTGYQKQIMSTVNPFALRVVDARKAHELEPTESVVILAKKSR